MKIILVVGIALLGVVGCTVPDREERVEAAGVYQASSQEATAKYFKEHPGALKLGECRELAKERTLKLTEARLNASLASLQKGAAFSAFLPQVNASYQRAGTNEQLHYNIMGGLVNMSDKYATTAAIQISQPVFAPSAWLLFANAHKNVRLQELIKERNEELLDVQIAALFYDAAVAEQRVGVYEAQCGASKELNKQVGELAEHGLALKGDRARIEALAQSDAYNLQVAKDAQVVSRAKLLDLLRFYPMQEVSVAGESLLEVLELPWAKTDAQGELAGCSRADALAAPVEEWFWSALVNRKEMWAGDLMIQIRKVEAIQALAHFLPTLSLRGGRAYNGESHITPHSYWTGAIGGTMAIFDGLQSITDYLAAKERQKAEFDLREDKASTLITATYESWMNWKQAMERLGVAKTLREAAEVDYAETKDRYENDQETMATLLDKLSAMERARIDALSVEYAAALAELVFRDTIGLGYGDQVPPADDTQALLVNAQADSSAATSADDAESKGLLLDAQATMEAPLLR